MKLDDRPVIDQPLNPTPLNLIHELHEHHIESILNREGEGLTSAQVEASLNTLAEFVDALEARL